MNPYLISYTPILSFSVIYFVYVFQKLQYQSKSKFLIYTCIFFTITGCGNWLSSYPGQDQSQWYYNGVSLFNNFNLWHSTFGLADHTRFFSILLYGLFWKIGITNPTIISCYLVLLSFITIILTTYKILENSVRKENIHLGIAIFAICISTFGRNEFWSFNSEHITISFYLIALYFIDKGAKSSYRDILYLFIGGLILTFTPFCKEQFAIIAIITFLLVSIQLIAYKNFKSLITFNFGCITSAFLIWLICLSSFSFLEIKSFYLIGRDYQNRDLISQEVVQYNFNHFIEFLESTLFNYHYLCFTFLIFVSVFFYTKEISSKKDKTPIWRLLIVLNLIVTLITLALSIKQPFHYSVLLYPSFLIFSIIGVEKLNKNKSIITIIIASYIVLTPIITREMKSIFPVKGYSTFENRLFDSNEYRLLKNTIPANNKVFLWGWANQYLIGIKSHRCTSFLYPQFAMKKLDCSNFVGDLYLKEIIKTKPDYFVELVGEKQFLTTDTIAHSLKNNQPKIFSYINQHYVKINVGEEIKIYKRID